MSNAREVIDLIYDQVLATDKKVDVLTEQMAAVRERLARVETRTALFGTAAGFLAGLIGAFLKGG